jgi:carboxyl-terminal processing protease
MSVTAGGPAETAGVQVGDILLFVDGESVEDLGLDGTKSAVRGEEGTSVTLTFRRAGETFDLSVTRASIETVVVSYEMLDDQIGLITIENFDTNCAKRAMQAIETLIGEGAQSLIFDVRYNPGGMKTELVELLDYLLPEGPLFYSYYYDGTSDVDYSDASYLDIPMAVLVNADSYSAAEFFAAALQEYGAAEVVGVQTCGKGYFQNTFRLSDGSAMAISTGRYCTPNGVSLAGVGITPDVVVELTEEQDYLLYYGQLDHAEDDQLQAAIALLTGD